MDIKSVRTFVMAIDLGQFQQVASELEISQQAVSKRIAALEQELGVKLLTRGAPKVKLTIDGQAFLPHARGLIKRENRALAAVRSHRRTLRVDVISHRVSQAALMRDFQESHPYIDIDLVTVLDGQAAVAALIDGQIDATFRALNLSDLPEGIEGIRAYNEPHRLLVGPNHPLATVRSISLKGLADYKIWMPGIRFEAEWTDYYKVLAAEFGLTISAVEQGFSFKELTAAIAESSNIATLEGERSRFVWPNDYDLRRIEIRPTPLYPHNLLWRTNDHHPEIETFKAYFATVQQGSNTSDIWLPEWAM